MSSSVPGAELRHRCCHVCGVRPAAKSISGTHSAQGVSVVCDECFAWYLWRVKTNMEAASVATAWDLRRKAEEFADLRRGRWASVSTPAGWVRALVVGSSSALIGLAVAMALL